jgi:hypothetical protein
MPRAAVSGPLAATLLLVASTLSAEDPIARGDAAWARRAEGHRGGRAAAGPISEAVSAYEEAIRADPQALDAYWKLERALWFQADYASATSAEKEKLLDRGRKVAEAALDRLYARAGGRERLEDMEPAAAARAVAALSAAVPLHVWAAVDWGLWGDVFGKVAAARQGVGTKVKRYGEIALALDERHDSGAPHRVLGRLHALAPKIPFITGWVDREAAARHLRRAVEIDPEFLSNRLFLAEALLDHFPARRGEALGLLRDLASRAPGSEWQVEDARTIADAGALLAREVR